MAPDNKHDSTPIERLATHVAILNDEMGVVQVDMATVKTNVGWLIKLGLWQLGLLGSLLLAAVGFILFG